MFMAKWLSHQEDQNSAKKDRALSFAVLLHGLQQETLTTGRQMMIDDRQTDR